MKYNVLFLMSLAKAYVVIFAVPLTQNNLNIPYLWYLFWIPFFAIRCVLLYVVFTEVFPAIPVIVDTAWTMNTDNWWQDPEEPFITNCSVVNALVSYPTYMYGFLIIVYFWFAVGLFTCLVIMCIV